MLTIAALAILLTAPLGSISISLLGPLLLKKNQQSSEDSNAGNHLVLSKHDSAQKLVHSHLKNSKGQLYTVAAHNCIFAMHNCEIFTM